MTIFGVVPRLFKEWSVWVGQKLADTVGHCCDLYPPRHPLHIVYIYKNICQVFINPTLYPQDSGQNLLFHQKSRLF